MYKRPLFAASIGFVLGEVCAWQAESGRTERFWCFLLGAVILGAAGLGTMVKTRRDKRHRHFRESKGMHKTVWILLLLCVFGAGYCRMAQALRKWETVENRIWADEETVEVKGKVEEIREKEKTTALTVDTKELGKILVYVDQEEGKDSVEGLRIGEKVRVRGEGSRFEEAANPGQFDLRAYYRSQGISAAVFAWNVEREGAEQGMEGMYSPYLDALYRFRRFCSRVFTQICEAEDAGIFRAAILGEKEGMDREIKDLYQDNGISHLLAISGLHLSLIGAGFHRVLRKCGLGYGISGGLAAAGIFSYGILTGASGSAMRAVIMLSVSFLAAYLGRTYDLLSALSLAALLLAGTRPFSITQSGFQLSFGAVLGIGVVGKALESGLGIKKSWGKSLAVSLSVQLATGPIVLWHYFQFPVYGVILNLAVVPLMAYVVISGLLGLGAGSISLGAGMIAVGTGHYILQFYQELCKRVSRLPGCLLIWGRPKPMQMVLYYLFLGAMVWGLRKEAKTQEKKQEDIRTKVRSRVILGAGVILCCLWIRPRPQQGLDIAVLDVGQGDGIVLQCEGGKRKTEGITWLDTGVENIENKERTQAVVLIDGGSSSDKRLGENRLEPYLKAEGISQIDFALVSHGDEDHISGLFYLLKECPEIAVSCLILPEAGIGDTGYEKLIDAAKNRKIPIGYMDAGDKLQAGACSFTCLYPGKGMDIDFSDRNQQSLMLRADYQDFHMLFTGDVGQEGETLALEYAEKYGGQEGLSSVQVLKAAHHGSRFSSGEAFLSAVRPLWTVISYQEGNSYGHPHEETLERLREQGSLVLETGKMGAILLHVEDKKARYQGWKGRLTVKQFLPFSSLPTDILPR